MDDGSDAQRADLDDGGYDRAGVAERTGGHLVGMDVGKIFDEFYQAAIDNLQA